MSFLVELSCIPSTSSVALAMFLVSRNSRGSQKAYSSSVLRAASILHIRVHPSRSRANRVGLVATSMGLAWRFFFFFSLSLIFEFLILNLVLIPYRKYRAQDTSRVFFHADENRCPELFRILILMNAFFLFFKPHIRAPKCLMNHRDRWLVRGLIILQYQQRRL